MRARCERCDASEWQVLRRESEDFLFQPDDCVQEVLYKNYVPPYSGIDHNSFDLFLSGFDVNNFLLRVVLIPKLNTIQYPANSFRRTVS
jgi:hypothetical protein